MNIGRLSVIILTKNEENNIIDCLETVNFADEIIIIDDDSSDRTKEIVQSLKNKKIKLYERKINEDFAKQRNYALKKANSEWTLFLDADERVSKKLQLEILKITKDKHQNEKGFFVRRTDHIWGKQINYGETANVRLLRLGKTKSGIWKGNVHEEWKIEGVTSTLTAPLHHYPHPAISDFVKDIDTYSTYRAHELARCKGKVNVFSIIGYPVAKFVLNFVVRKGYKDGVEGFLIATMMSLHSFLVRAKLWHLVGGK